MKRLSTHPNPALAGWRFGEGVPEPNLWYRGCRRVLQVAFSALWKTQVFNRHYEPTRGSALYLCNHQSFLDPPLMSFALRRPMNYMARDSLFRHPVFRRLIESLNAFPVRRGAADTAALKEAMRRLKAGGQLVVFPEGTRTEDGRIGPFLPGLGLLARRAADWIVPTVIDGAYECWPRSQPLPLPGKIVIVYGRPIPGRSLGRQNERAWIARVRERMIAMQADIRRRLGRPPIRYD
jgi:1-acyl-sn-glycerol-3-phosphate acyltransferase